MKKILIVLLFVFLTFCGIAQNDNSFVKECELPNDIRDEIINRKKWPDDEKNAIVDFLEEYMCAYLNKRIGYLKYVFSHGFDELNNNVQVTRNYAEEYLDKYSTCCFAGDITDFVISEFNIRSSNNSDGYYYIWFKQQYVTRSYFDEGIYVLIRIQVENNKPVIKIAEMNDDKEAVNPINIRYN